MKKKVWPLWALLAIITIVAILHLVRAVMGWSLAVENLEIPVWLSYVAFLVLGYFSYKLFVFLRK